MNQEENIAEVAVDLIKSTDTLDLEIGSLKLVLNKHRIGPDVNGRKSVDLSKAASKIKLNNALKIEAVPKDKPGKEPKLEKSKGDDESTKEKGDSESRLIYSCYGKDKSDLSAIPAFAANSLVFMESWDYLYKGKLGTPDYLEKVLAYENRKAELYNSMGIQLGLNQDRAKKRPYLTEAQRLKYNETMAPLGFVYWEVYISYRQPERAPVRSTSYRYLTKPSLEVIHDRLESETRNVLKNIRVVSR